MALHKDVRRRRALEAFERRLDQASPDEIRAMLAQRRIRSAERIELAQARLRQHGTTASSTASADRSQAQDRRRAQAVRGMREEVPLTRQIGRMLGIGLGIAGIAALAVFTARR